MLVFYQCSEVYKVKLNNPQMGTETDMSSSFGSLSTITMRLN